jgi:hypothetical protein
MSYFMIASAGFASYPNDKCPATMEPPIPGVMPGLTHPKIILGVDIDYPPYGTLSFPPDTEDIEVAGFGPDIAAGMKEVCNIEVHTTQIGWSECWDSNKIGESLKAATCTAARRTRTPSACATATWSFPHPSSTQTKRRASLPNSTITVTLW